MDSYSELVREEDLSSQHGDCYSQHLVGDNDHDNSKQESVDAKEGAVGPPSTHFVGQHSSLREYNVSSSI